MGAPFGNIMPPIAASMASLAGLTSPRDILGLKNRFKVTIGNRSLGSWGACNQLAVQFENKAIQVGAVYDHEVYLPIRLKYPAIVLRRAINPQDSKALQEWLAEVADKWMHDANGSEMGETATITLYDATGTDGGIMTWTLRNVYPSKWSGPELDAMTAGIAMESLELIHEGFL
jgi:phage tail-like protein